jgi:hypothetical protein
MSNILSFTCLLVNSPVKIGGIGERGDMPTNLTFQELLNKAMKDRNWGQREVARRVSEELGRKVHAGTINKMLRVASKPIIPKADVMEAIATIFELDIHLLIRLAYAEKYAKSGLTAVGYFVGKSFDDMDEDEQAAMLESLRRRK